MLVRAFASGAIILGPLLLFAAELFQRPQGEPVTYHIVFMVLSGTLALVVLAGIVLAFFQELPRWAWVVSALLSALATAGAFTVAPWRMNMCQMICMASFFGWTVLAWLRSESLREHPISRFANME